MLTQLDVDDEDAAIVRCVSGTCMPTGSIQNQQEMLWCLAGCAALD